MGVCGVPSRTKSRTGAHHPGIPWSAQRAVGAAGAVALRLEFVKATEWSVTARRAEGWGFRTLPGLDTLHRHDALPEETVSGRAGRASPHTDDPVQGPREFLHHVLAWLPLTGPGFLGTARPLPPGNANPSFLPPQPERYLIRLL